ncbi:acetyltransferase [Phlyctema vagabunda]|uniref:Acetyltransferase n=1 Tax=Phlyctema vagabunda TaxID=108571 RepID=A0ABR4PE46_9HELO
MATPNLLQAHYKEQVCIEIIHDPQDFEQSFHIQSAAFGTQANDAIWMAFSPSWDTPSGKLAGAARLTKRFNATTINQPGQPNTLFLKATAPSTRDSDARKIVGFAIWQQLSAVAGHGDSSPQDLYKSLGVRELYPNDANEQRFLVQVLGSLHKRRFEVVEEKKNDNAQPPAILVLDICAVDPSYQRQGIAAKLVQYGLDEAKRRGVEATTEASSMGRGVYIKLGFKPEGNGEDIIYSVDKEFESRKKPSNVFLRTAGKE